ncbi:MAG: hypothetical protein HGA66_08575 [Holophaga sp.]|nr:hypothetical protein [Holophaga sp.]
MILLPESSGMRRFLLAGVLAASGLVGCIMGGDKAPGDRAGQLNGPFTITPPTAQVLLGQTFHFTASSPWGGGTTWTVLPATAGTIDATGTFTAAATAGTCQIVAMYDKDPRYTATASVHVLAVIPAHVNPSLVQASGKLQIQGTLRTGNVVGETFPARKSATADGVQQVRHGFDPPTHN